MSGYSLHVTTGSHTPATQTKVDGSALQLLQPELPTLLVTTADFSKTDM